MAQFPVRRASLDEYLRSPASRFTAGDGWVHGCAEAPWLAAVIFWGTLKARALEDVLACATAAREAIGEPHAALIDGRRVLSIDAACFAPTSEYVLANRGRLRESVAQLGGVRPLGLFGAVAEGFFRVVPAPYPVSVFAERGEALRWLGCEEHAAALDAIEREASGERADVLAPVHRALATDLTRPSQDDVARALGVSARTLQRRLKEAGTSFQREVTIVRIREAQRLMRDTDHTLARIAIDAGFASAATFSVAFRKVIGQSPRDWREAEERARR